MCSSDLDILPESIPKCPIPRFLNRLLGLKVRMQFDLFNYFARMQTSLRNAAMKLGTYDRGVLGMSLI